MAHQILRLPAVKARTGLSRSNLYLKISRGEFPKPISLGMRAVGFLETDVEDWIARQIESSRKATVGSERP
jgi:prophage regulatory protein